MLTTQYRMHEKIMRFPSDELYESKLVAADGVKARLLKDLPYEVEDTEDTSEPLIFFDTQGGDFPEKNEEDDVDKKKPGKGIMGDSKSNEMEAVLVKKHVQNLVDAGVQPTDIAVITPYNAQVSLSLLYLDYLRWYSAWDKVCALRLLLRSLQARKT
jgi:DNA polymerase alpha-associated DNA helicase A